MKKIYFDYASTTPCDSRVKAAMLPFFDKQFGNTMSFHQMGTEAAEALENARGIVAKSINSEPDEIIFTASATECNNLTLKGIAHAYKHKGNKIIISSVEHNCIYESAMFLKDNGYEVVMLKVDKYGFVDLEDLKSQIDDKTILVSVIHGNNEVGTINDIREIGKICRAQNVLFHTDASQSYGKVIIDVVTDNIDLMTISSHKIYGPKGAAALYMKKGIRITPQLHGGGHENDRRSSTVNVPAIVGFGKAVELIFAEFKEENEKLILFRDRIIKTILEKVPDAKLNGHPTKRLSNNANFSFTFAEGEAMLVALDMAGIECSTGSACSTATLEPSRIIMGLGATCVEAHGSIRISIGRFTTEEEIDHLLKVLPEVVDNVKKFSPFTK